jgi:ketosteroid isomerase-like protein
MKTVCVLLLLLSVTVATAQSNDETEIRALLRAQTESWNRGDLEGFMQTYCKSDSLMFIGRNGVVWGWQKTLDNYKRSYPNKAAMGMLSFEIIQVKKLSDTYYHVTGKWMLQRAEDKPSGHYTLLLQKINGSWKIVSDHSSQAAESFTPHP